MAKKIVKKRKIKIVPVLILLLILFLLCLAVKLVLDIRIDNIYIHGNNSLSDEYIISYLNLEDYPSNVKNTRSSLKSKLEKNPYIKKAEVNKKFFSVVDITIEENELLFYNVHDKKYVFRDKTETDDIPYSTSYVKLINYVPDTEYPLFVKMFARLSNEVIDKISEIKYDPNDFDTGRFLFYMIDGNYVYVTSTKLESINYYNEIYPTLEGKKGTLYLDSGNHFTEFSH